MTFLILHADDLYQVYASILGSSMILTHLEGHNRVDKDLNIVLTVFPVLKVSRERMSLPVFSVRVCIRNLRRSLFETWGMPAAINDPNSGDGSASGRRPQPDIFQDGKLGKNCFSITKMMIANFDY